MHILSLPHKVMLAAGFVVLTIITLVAVFLVDKPVKFSYAGETCVQQLTLFPGQTRPTGDFGFEVTPRHIFRIGHIQVASLETCFTATKAPTPGVTKVSVGLFGGWLGKKTYAVDVPSPAIADTQVLSQPVPTAKPLAITLNTTDVIFEYGLVIDNASAACPIKESVVYCEIADLNLLQGKAYTMRLDRLFGGKKVSTVVEKDIQTLIATSVTGASIQNGQVIYDKPKSFTVTFDKDIINADITVKDNNDVAAIAASQISGKQATITVGEDLKRNTTYHLGVDGLEAADGSTLTDPYSIDFFISDGPKVTNVSVGTTGAPLTQTVTISFDQPLLADQDITKLVAIKGINATITKKNNQIQVSYSNAPVCTDFTMSIAAGLLSNYSVVQNNSWSFSTRTVCHITTTIGYSKDGRAIVAYIFGTGSKTILYTGAIHGNELSSKYLMDAWINELEVNARTIPTDKKIIVVPVINPDGVAANRRNNSNNIDLNRNFDTSDWQTDIVSPSNQPIAGGGGASSMSEPETKAIAAYTALLRPRLTMSFHGSAAYAIGNQAGDSASLAATYASMTGYTNQTGNSSNAFGYVITGTYDDWIAERLGLPSVLIELASSTNAEFSRNKAALWAMVKA